MFRLPSARALLSAAALLIAPPATIADPPGPAPGAPACEIVIGSCHRPPLSTPEGAGAIDRVVIEAFRRVGRRACITALPCERSLLNADSGLIDGDLLRIPAVLASRYPHLAAVPELLYPLPMHAFATRTDLRLRGLDDLVPLRVGYILGWKVLEDRVRATQVTRVRGPELLFPLLAEGRADVVIYERLTGLYQIQALGLPGIVALEPPLLVTPQHLCLHRRHEALLEPLAAALRAMKADGTYRDAFLHVGAEPPVRP